MTQLLLPEAVIQRAETQAAQKGFDSLADYLTSLLERDANPFAGREDEVEEAILEGIASGPGIVMTEERWQELYDDLGKARTSERQQ
jgi:hypothetical protein